MKARFSLFRLVLFACVKVLLVGCIAGSCQAQHSVTTDPPSYGPYNATFLPDGDGLHKPLLKDDSILRASSPWSIYAWIKPAEDIKTTSLVAGIGDPSEEFPRYLALENGHAMLWIGKGNELSSTAAVDPGQWHFLAATFDGEQFVLYSDGVKAASGKLDAGSVSPILQVAPPSSTSELAHFGGAIASLTVLRRAISADEAKQLAQAPQDSSSTEFEEGSKPWPVQTRGQAGYSAPQDPATMPQTKAIRLSPSCKTNTRAGGCSGHQRQPMEPGSRLDNAPGAEG